jgi:hypothetical protein
MPPRTTRASASKRTPKSKHAHVTAAAVAALPRSLANDVCVILEHCGFTVDARAPPSGTPARVEQWMISYPGLRNIDFVDAIMIAQIDRMIDNLHRARVSVVRRVAVQHWFNDARGACTVRIVATC